MELICGVAVGSALVGLGMLPGVLVFLSTCAVILIK